MQRTFKPLEAASIESGILAQSSLSESINLDSLEHTPSPNDDQPLSSVYTKLQKAKTPSPTPAPNLNLLMCQKPTNG